MTPGGSHGDLQLLWDSVLEPRLRAIEHERLKLRKAIVASALCVGIPILCFVASESIASAIGVNDVVAAVGSFALIFAGVVVAGFKFALPGFTAFTNYRARFKREVAAEIFRVICPGAEYAADRSITPQVFHASGIFTTRGVIRGDDLVRGRIGGTPFEASEVNHFYKTGSSNRSTRYDVFHGLFFHIESGRSVRGRTIVQPVRQASWRLGPRDGLERMQLDDAEFDERFEVYADDPAGARAILTPAVASRLLDVSEKTGRPVFASFADARAYVAIHYGRSLFEPSIAASTTFEALTEMADHFRLAEAIVEHVGQRGSGDAEAASSSLLSAAPVVGQMEALNAGDLTEGDLVARALRQVGVRYNAEDEGVKAAPADTRIRVFDAPEGVTIEYGRSPWFVPTLLFCGLAVALAAVAATIAVRGDAGRAWAQSLATRIGAGAALANLIADAPLIWLGGVVLVVSLPALWLFTHPFRVQVGREAIGVWRGLRLTPRRYPISDQTRILQMDKYLYLARADEQKLTNPALSPQLKSADEAQWAASHMRRGLARGR